MHTSPQYIWTSKPAFNSNWYSAHNTCSMPMIEKQNAASHVQYHQPINIYSDIGDQRNVKVKKGTCPL